MVDRFRAILPSSVLALLIVYFGFQALTGDRGLLSTRHRDQTLEQKTLQLASLRAERTDLEVRARLLRDQSLSADLLEERARSRLGFADPRDYVIRTRP